MYAYMEEAFTYTYLHCSSSPSLRRRFTTAESSVLRIEERYVPILSLGLGPEKDLLELIWKVALKPIAIPLLGLFLGARLDLFSPIREREI